MAPDFSNHLFSYIDAGTRFCFTENAFVFYKTHFLKRTRFFSKKRKKEIWILTTVVRFTFRFFGTIDDFVSPKQSF